MSTGIEPASCYDELVDMLDDVRVARGLSFELLEELGGLASDHAQKALGPARAKLLSPMLLDTLLPVLGVRLAIVDDPQAIASIERRWEHRDETNVRKNNWRVSRRILDRARPHILREIAQTLTAAAAACVASQKATGAESTAQPIASPSPRLVHELAATPAQAGNEPVFRDHLRIVQHKSPSSRS
ncbi:hypothetical protein ACVWWO_009533 [Bradyrhizobium sp. F1.13.1]